MSVWNNRDEVIADRFNGLAVRLPLLMRTARGLPTAFHSRVTPVTSKNICTPVSYPTIRGMRFTTQWRAAFKVQSFKAVVIRRKWFGVGWGEGGEVVVGDCSYTARRQCFIRSAPDWLTRLHYSVTV